MFKRSDEEWNKIGRAKPYWGVLTDERYLSQNTDEAA